MLDILVTNSENDARNTFSRPGENENFSVFYDEFGITIFIVKSYLNGFAVDFDYVQHLTEDQLERVVNRDLRDFYQAAGEHVHAVFVGLDVGQVLVAMRISTIGISGNLFSAVQGRHEPIINAIKSKIPLPF